MAIRQDRVGAWPAGTGGVASAAHTGLGCVPSGMYRPMSSSSDVSKLAVGDSYWILR